MPDSDDVGKSDRDARMVKSREEALATLAAVREAKNAFIAAGAAAVVTQKLTPDPNGSRFRSSMLHEALRPFFKLGKVCDTEQP